MKRFQVLLLTEVYNHLTYEGIVRYAREANWSLNLRYLSYRQIPEEWQGDGILSFYTRDDRIRQLISASSVPVVDLGTQAKEFNLPRVWKDDEAIGTMAADYFLQRGFKEFAFYRYLGDAERIPSNHLRYDTFKRTVLAGDGRFYELNHERLTEQLHDLPKPMALMAGNDDHALVALEACESVGLRVPEEVSILGVDNNPDYCDLAPTPLSSIDSDCPGVGYEAARLLGQLMDGGKAPDEPIRISPKEVVTRQSTDILAVPHLPAATALKFLMHHFRDPNLNLDDVAKESGISRRNLEGAFKRHLGFTMFDYLEQLRVDAALAMLKEPDYKGYEIAYACGFSNLDHLSRVLRKRFGKSMRALRKSGV